MGYVTDGGLEPEPVASIKGLGRSVNGDLALFGADFRYFPANFGMEDAGRRRDGGGYEGMLWQGCHRRRIWRRCGGWSSHRNHIRLARWIGGIVSSPSRCWRGVWAVFPRTVDSGLRRNDGCGGRDGGRKSNRTIRNAAYRHYGVACGLKVSYRRYGVAGGLGVSYRYYGVASGGYQLAAVARTARAFWAACTAMGGQRERV